VGRNSLARPGGRLVAQSSALLASDALALLRHVWPSPARLHVFGVSMGGMVAQRLALALLAAQQEADTRGIASSPPLPRLASLTLSVTARAYGLACTLPPLPPRLLRAALAPLLVRASASAVVAWLLPRCFPPDVLAAQHEAAGGATVGALWQRRWTAEYAQWFLLSRRRRVRGAGERRGAAPPAGRRHRGAARQRCAHPAEDRLIPLPAARWQRRCARACTKAPLRGTWAMRTTTLPSSPQWRAISARRRDHAMLHFQLDTAPACCGRGGRGNTLQL
jgi:pimeloyl-ACP methyl ester carboxylesterase